MATKRPAEKARADRGRPATAAPILAENAYGSNAMIATRLGAEYPSPELPPSNDGLTAVERVFGAAD